MGILVVLLCIAIVVSAVWADRSARSKRTFRAVALNLCGIGCLCVGLLAIYLWSHGGIVVTRQVTVASSGDNHETVVRLLVDSDARGTAPRPDEGADTASDTGANDTTQTLLITAEAEPQDDGVIIEIVDQRAGDEPSAQSPKNAAAAGDDTAGDDTAGDDTGGDDTGGELTPDAKSNKIVNFDARPMWVEQEDQDAGNVHQISVGTDPFPTLRKARQALYEQLKEATDRYINEFTGSSQASYWIDFNESRVRTELVSAEKIYDEQVHLTVGDWHQSHALLELGPGFHREMELRWHRIVARARLVMVALAGGAVLGILVLLFGYFNADTATRGFYSGRLKFVTAVAILGLIAAGIFLARSIPWLWV